MRWFDKKLGITRIRCKFLLFPVCIDGEHRWLERARWLEQYIEFGYDNTWARIRWLPSDPAAPESETKTLGGEEA